MKVGTPAQLPLSIERQIQNPAQVRPRRTRIFGDALAVDRRAAELTSTDLQRRELYAIASLLDD